MHFLFLIFSPSKLYQLCMLLTLDEDNVMFVITLHCGCVDCGNLVKIGWVALFEKEM